LLKRSQPLPNTSTGTTKPGCERTPARARYYLGAPAREQQHVLALAVALPRAEGAQRLAHEAAPYAPDLGQSKLPLLGHHRCCHCCC
jgi:hypothetical protein